MPYNMWFPLLLLSSIATSAWAHGRVLEPPSRASAWRFGYPVPANYDDDGLNCGGYSGQHSSNGGKCGVCGDPYNVTPPRPHELGGTFGVGVITGRYQPGGLIATTVDLTTSHKGFWEFKLCPDPESTNQACFDRYVLEHEDGDTKYYPNQGSTKYNVTYKLPDKLVCEHCVLQWRYTAGNNWGICGNGTSGLGCGPQEQFGACSDVSIGNSKSLLRGGENDVAPLVYYLKNGYFDAQQGVLQVLRGKVRPNTPGFHSPQPNQPRPNQPKVNEIPNNQRPANHPTGPSNQHTVQKNQPTGPSNARPLQHVFPTGPNQRPIQNNTPTGPSNSRPLQNNYPTGPNQRPIQSNQPTGPSNSRPLQNNYPTGPNQRPIQNNTPTGPSNSRPLQNNYPTGPNQRPVQNNQPIWTTNLRPSLNIPPTGLSNKHIVLNNNSGKSNSRPVQSNQPTRSSDQRPASNQPTGPPNQQRPKQNKQNAAHSNSIQFQQKKQQKPKQQNRQSFQNIQQQVKNVQTPYEQIVVHPNLKKDPQTIKQKQQLQQLQHIQQLINQQNRPPNQQNIKPNQQTGPNEKLIQQAEIQHYYNKKHQNQYFQNTVKHSKRQPRGRYQQWKAVQYGTPHKKWKRKKGKHKKRKKKVAYFEYY